MTELSTTTAVGVAAACAAFTCSCHCCSRDGSGSCAGFGTLFSFILCEGRALAIVRGAPDHDGLEAWRLLHEWHQPKTRSRCLALLNEILGWDFGAKEQFLQRMKDWENATLEYNRIASAPLQEKVLVAVLISRSLKEIRTYLQVQVREETAKLSHVRQLLYDNLRAGKAWKAPRTEEVAEANSPKLV